jgi:hypothetical protein
MGLIHSWDLPNGDGLLCTHQISTSTFSDEPKPSKDKLTLTPTNALGEAYKFVIKHHFRPVPYLHKTLQYMLNSGDYCPAPAWAIPRNELSLSKAALVWKVFIIREIQRLTTRQIFFSVPPILGTKPTMSCRGKQYKWVVTWPLRTVSTPTTISTKCQLLQHQKNLLLETV